MGYKPRVWKSKELITAPKLNNIENAIKEINLKFDGLYGNNKGESKMHIANVEITPNSDVNKSDIIADMELTAITDLSGNLKGLSGTCKPNKENAVSHKISFTITRE